MRFISFDNVLTCLGDNEEKNGLLVFCQLYERYKQYFTLFDFIMIVNDYLQFDDIELLPYYFKAVYHIKGGKCYEQADGIFCKRHNYRV